MHTTEILVETLISYCRHVKLKVKILAKSKFTCSFYMYRFNNGLSLCIKLVAYIFSVNDIDLRAYVYHCQQLNC